MLKREQYLNQLISKRDNRRVKVITGLRRAGKSVLLFDIYRNYLIENGVSEDHILGLALDVLENAKYRNPFELDRYFRERMTDHSGRYYIFIDEIQFVAEIPNPYVPDSNEKITFVDVVLGLARISNADVYVTGSNSKMLSKDILTQFRDRADEIKVFPLSYAEFYEAYQGDKRGAWQEYYTYGGMPYTLSLSSHEEKSRYLHDLCEQTYIKDVLDRHDIRKDSEVLGTLLDITASDIGALTNPLKISRTFYSEEHISVTPDTIAQYLEYFTDSFLLEGAEKYDVKGRKLIDSPVKYYFADVGLRNARLNFRQIEETHLMENIIFNDLIRRGFDVDVGEVEYNTRNSKGTKIRKQLEVDFVVNRGDERYYIQSALNISDPQKREQEIASLLRIPDSFRKIAVVKDYVEPWFDDHGIEYIGVEQFLLNDHLHYLP